MKFVRIEDTRTDPDSTRVYCAFIAAVGDPLTSRNENQAVDLCPVDSPSEPL